MTESPASITRLKQPGDVRIVDKDDLAAMSDYLDKEISIAWQRKVSFESRAFPIVTMDVGLVTLYLTLVKSLDLKLVTTGFWPTSIALLIVLAAALSILAAALVALPSRYPGYSAGGFAELYQEILDEKQVAHEQRIVESKIGSYEIACQSNHRKARMVFVAFFLMALLACLLIISILVAL
ncbi:hypothetical protein [Nocardia sp. NPDC005366]|uniref:hypothetical protein n=1 Tax=Nocardia sp. NPDC005366 TaxID=3156878 RepID=UPI0033B29884